MDSLLPILLIIGIIVIIALVAGAAFIIKCVSMYQQSEKDKKYDKMLSEPLKKFGDTSAENLAEKYNNKNEGEQQ